MRYRWLSLFIFSTLCLNSQPWGKDADLAMPVKKQESPCINDSIFSKLGQTAIRFHQVVISPADGPRSHFIPSSSQYTLDAMKKYGFFEGVARGCDRLMRENNDPWCYRTVLDPQGHPIKWDPVK